MPPVTPSPRRFLPGQRRPKSIERPTAQDSEARRLLPPTKPSVRSDRSQDVSESTTAQFAATPRFAHKISDEQSTYAAPTSLKPIKILANSLRKNFQTVEDVEEAAADVGGSNERLHLSTPSQAHLVSEDNGCFTAPLDLPHSSKRLKLTPSHDPKDKLNPDILETSAKQPGMINHQRQNLKFVHPHTIPPSTEDGVGHSLNHPAFLRPQARSPEVDEPLPDAFSPHRRSQKFTPGGMASTLQQWIVEAGQAAVQSRRGRGFRQGDDFVMSAELSKVQGEGPFSVIGKSQNGDEIRALLVGNATGADSIYRGLPETGSIIGIRAPSWETEMLGQRWIVGVDWRVLN